DVFMPIDKLAPLFSRLPYLTRLATFISPEEMTHDPLFVTNPSLSEVVPQHMAVGHVMCGDEAYFSCSAPVRLQLEDGRDVWYQAGGQCGGAGDRGALDRMPSADVGFRREADGEGTVELDNRDDIKTALARHNRAVGDAIDGGCGCALARGGRARTVLGGLALAALLVLRLR